jgi:DNA-binding NtrC family response regulator
VAQKRRILIVDDEVELLRVISMGLKGKGYDVLTAAGGEEAIAKCRENSIDAVLLDIKMPKMDGFRTLKRIKSLRSNPIVIMHTAYGTIESAVESIKEGAYDYILKPSEPEKIHLLIKNAIEHRELADENRLLKSQLKKKYKFSEIIGSSSKMQDVFSTITKIMKTDTTVLIIGETGTGKELVARAIHYNSPRSDKRMCTIHCATIPDELMESELFGYERGAFTGAIAAKKGAFEVADGGTLFLDEIGEMSPIVQAKLLRFLQEKEFTRLGSNNPIRVDVRLITATNRDLKSEIEKGRFRKDLYYRLNVVEILLPPLRERNDDVPLLVNSFLQKYKPNGSAAVKKISPKTMNLLMDYDWPGNVRELEHAIERAVVISARQTILPHHVPQIQTSKQHSDKLLTSSALLPLRKAKEVFEKQYLIESLRKSRGNIAQASRFAGIAWQNFQRKLKAYHIKPKDFIVD